MVAVGESSTWKHRLQQQIRTAGKSNESNRRKSRVGAVNRSAISGCGQRAAGSGCGQRVRQRVKQRIVAEGRIGV